MYYYIIIIGDVIMKLNLKNIKKLFIGFALISMFYSTIISLIGETFKEKDFIEVEVLPGDSVWKIAERISLETNQNTNEVVDWILKENHLHETTIYPGQNLIIPVEAGNEEGEIEIAFES